MRRFLVTLGLLLFAIAGQAQTQVYGTVLDAENGEPLIGASVYLEEYSMGSVTDFDGRFRFVTRQTGEAHVVASMIGYTNSRNYIQLPARQGGRNIGMAAMDMGVLRLAASTIGLNEANVIASVAIDRETPVAVSTLDARTIQEQLGDKELVETLNITPGVYATKSGGGFGDSRINIRGFDQRNVAVLINGIPVNDMENGWVYWSNWAGLGDAVNTMQVQRGLGASKLAINSVGGTLNIITKATDMKKGGSLLQSVTDYGRYKIHAVPELGRDEEWMGGERRWEPHHGQCICRCRFHRCVELFPHRRQRLWSASPGFDSHWRSTNPRTTSRSVECGSVQ